MSLTLSADEAYISCSGGVRLYSDVECLLPHHGATVWSRFDPSASGTALSLQALTAAAHVYVSTIYALAEGVSG